MEHSVLDDIGRPRPSRGRPIESAPPDAGHEHREFADRVYWAMSRLINHGWVVDQFGPDGWLSRDGQGRRHGVWVDHDCATEPLLQVHVCRLLADLRYLGAAERGAIQRRITAKLRLHVPAGKPHPDDGQQPWYLPSVVGEQPCAAVRRAYWTALTLTDDYEWRIVALHSGGFEAITPGTTSPAPFRHDARCSATTASTLADLLAALGDQVSQLAALVLAHQDWANDTACLAGGGQR